MKNKARKDIHYFGLLWLAFKTRGRLFTNTHFGANALLQTSTITLMYRSLFRK